MAQNYWLLRYTATSDYAKPDVLLFLRTVIFYSITISRERDRYTVAI